MFLLLITNLGKIKNLENIWLQFGREQQLTKFKFVEILNTANEDYKNQANCANKNVCKMQ